MYLTYYCYISEITRLIKTEVNENYFLSHFTRPGHLTKKMAQSHGFLPSQAFDTCTLVAKMQISLCTHAKAERVKQSPPM